MVAIDIETTGLSKKDCGICQLSIVKFDPNTFEIINTFDTYLKPRTSAIWNEGAMNCSGITRETVKNSPSIKDKAEEILAFIDNDDILTYNGNTFDIPFLQEELKREGVSLILSGRKIYDSYYIESLLHPRKLANVYKRYTGKTMESAGLVAHNSLSDVLATIEIFKNQAANAPTGVVLYTENNFSGVVGRDDQDRKVFLVGKYRGLPVSDVIIKDPNWVSWLIKEKKDPEFYNFIKEEYTKIKDGAKDKQ